MAVSGFFKFAQRALFSKPSAERQLIKIAKRQNACRVVELGIESASATAKLIKEITPKQEGAPRASYTGLDAFDERPHGADPLSLIEAHRTLASSGARVRLQPGGPTAGVPLLANSLQDSDLVLLSPWATDELMTPVWYFLPRMCHPGTLVLRRAPGAEADDPGGWEPVPLEEIGRLAAQSPVKRAA